MNHLISVIIPARDEAKNIAACINAINQAKDLAKCNLEIIVVINRCTDNTEEIVRSYGCKIVYSEAKNLSQIRNTGVKEAIGEIIVTIDADSRMSSNMFIKIIKQMSSDRICAGGVLIVPERLSTGILATGLLLLPTIILKRVFGGLFFFRKEDFNAIGGFDESFSSAEDIDFAYRIRKFAARSDRKCMTLFTAYIITSCRKFDLLGDWYFVFRPKLLFDLLNGGNKIQANKIWYDFPRN